MPAQPGEHHKKNPPENSTVINDDKEPRKITATELIERAYQAIPDIVKDQEERESLVEPTELFDPKFRKQLEFARREQIRQEELERSLAKPPHVEVTADYGDYIGLRIGNKCWRYPVIYGFDPFDSKIPMLELNCPKEKNMLFSESFLLQHLSK